MVSRPFLTPELGSSLKLQLSLDLPVDNPGAMKTLHTSEYLADVEASAMIAEAAPAGHLRGEVSSRVKVERQV